MNRTECHTLFYINENAIGGGLESKQQKKPNNLDSREIARAAESKPGPRGSKWMRAPCLTAIHDNSIFNLILLVNIQVVTKIDIEFALFLVNICK